jgi:hypothetical protein
MDQGLIPPLFTLLKYLPHYVDMSIVVNRIAICLGIFIILKLWIVVKKQRFIAKMI